MRLSRLAVTAIAILSPCAAATNELQVIVERAYRPGVVKIDVTSSTPVFNGGVNICQSEGTGFVLNRQTVVTADHVIALDPRCGPPIISVRAPLHQVERIAQRLAGKNDAALLRLTEELPQQACSLRVRATDSFNQLGFRIGIAGGLSYPTPKPVRTGDEFSDFSPQVELTPTITEKGESGSPVIVYFNVVGIVRERHAKMPSYSAMIPGRVLRELIVENSIRLDNNACNPMSIETFPVDIINSVSRIVISNAYTPEFQAQLRTDVARNLGTENVLGRLQSVQPSISLGTNSLAVQTNLPRPTDGLIASAPWAGPPPLTPPSPQREPNARAISAAMEQIIQKQEQETWNRLAEQAKARGLWNFGR